MRFRSSGCLSLPLFILVPLEGLFYFQILLRTQSGRELPEAVLQQVTLTVGEKNAGNKLWFLLSPIPTTLKDTKISSISKHPDETLSSSQLKALLLFLSSSTICTWPRQGCFSQGEVLQRLHLTLTLWGYREYLHLASIKYPELELSLQNIALLKKSKNWANTSFT